MLDGVSLDQLAAEQVGSETRFSSIVLACTSEGGQTLSCTRSGGLPGHGSACSDLTTTAPSAPRSR